MRSWTPLFIFVILFSCSNDHNKFHSFNEDGWEYNNTLNFKNYISDTTNMYEMSLIIRHTVDYEFQNLFLFLGKDHKDTIEIILANKNGKWLGEGICDVREVEYVFERERVFERKGNFEIDVEQAMRYGASEKIETLNHILDVGLRICIQK